MRLRHSISRSDGFTLLEASIASIILILALVPLLALSGQCFRYIADVRRSARATQVLQQKMEDLRILSWTALATNSTSFVDSNSFSTVYHGTVLTNSYIQYTGTTTVMEVTLRVTWQDQTGNVQTNYLSTFISNGGLSRYMF